MTQSSDIIKGKVYVLEDDIDTDQIIPAQYLNLVPTIPEEYTKLGSYAMAGLPENADPFILEGTEITEYDIIIAGRNFGCGSSREHAPVCLGAAGTQAIVAESYARIFFRNSVATGEVYPLESEVRLCELFNTGDEAEISLSDGTVRNISSGETYSLKPLGAVGPVIEAGGIFGYARAVGMIDGGSEPETDTEESDKQEPAISTDEPIPEPEEEKPKPPQRKVSDIPRLRTKIYAISNQKGGVGKTTTVINLAACLAAEGKRVLIIDLDPQANATSGLGLGKQTGNSIHDALFGEKPAIDLIQKTDIKGLHIIPSELDLAGCEIDIARTEGYLHCFTNAIIPILEKLRYDYILIDCPPSLGILTMNALTAAHGMIIPMQCEYYALEGLSVINHLVEELRTSEANPDIEIEGILLTMYDKRTRLGMEVVKEVRKHFGTKVFRTVIPRNVRLGEAPSFGQSIIQYDRRSSGAKAYKKLAKEFLKRRLKAKPKRRKR